MGTISRIKAFKPIGPNTKSGSRESSMSGETVFLIKSAEGEARELRVAEAAVPMEQHIGGAILDFYEVKQVGQEGSMALVYGVHNNEWGIDLAVKIPWAYFSKIRL